MLFTRIIIAFRVFSFLAAASTDQCRCYPGDSCWPSAEEWQAFNATVDGRLIKTIPLGHVCHEPTYDEQACHDLRHRWTAPETHIESSHSIMVPVFANYSCSPWAERDSPCELGAYVQYSVNVSSFEEVAHTINFVRTHDIRLVIRNTGHDYLGKSSGPGSLAVWTHYMKSLEILYWDDQLYQGQAIRLGAGVQGSELIDFAAQYNLTALTGNCPSVGIAGGYIQGGGHSALSSKYGLAADQLLEMEIVDALGTHKVVNRVHEADLFWALSGGGAGTFAVVLSVTVRAYQDLPSAAASLGFNASGVEERTFLAGVRLYNAMLPALHEAGCSTAMYTVTRHRFQIDLFLCHGKTTNTVLELLGPFMSGLDNLHIAYQHSTTRFSRWSDGARVGWLNDRQKYEIGHVQAATWLIPRSAVLDPDTNARTLDAILRIQECGAFVGLQTFGPSRAVAAATDNAVFPGWRDVALLVWVIVPSNDALPLAKLLQDQQRLSTELMPMIQAVAPGGGTYLNEADPVDVNWKRNFYGDNYNQLLAVKEKYDPEGIFYARTAVGSDKWVLKHDGRLCRASRAEQGSQEDEL